MSAVLERPRSAQIANLPDHTSVRFSGSKKKIGVYLGTWPDPKTGRVWHLRTDDVQPRGILVMGPPGSGKSACIFIPSLLTFPESAFVYDPKFELFNYTAGYRAQRMGQKILLFAPTRPDISCSFNVFDEIRWYTVHELDDVQGQVKLILDPSDKAAEGAEAHWIVCGSILLECTMMFLRYYDPSKCHLAGCYDFLTDPRWQDPADENAPTGVEAALDFMANTPLDPQLKYGWRDADGNPSPFHPYIVHSALEVKTKATNERSGVVSTTTRFLQPFRTDTLRQLTSSSDFRLDDLMNYERPVTLYFCIPPAEIQRLRPVVRLLLNLLVRAHTGDEALIYKNGEPHYRYKWRCLLAVDEFPQLGKQEQFALALSIMRSYGLWPMLGVQAPNQIYDAFGRYQAVTGMLYYKIFYRPNDPEAAEWISKYLGDTTVPQVSQAYSGSRFGIKSQMSETISWHKEPLMSAGALLGMPEESAIIMYGSDDPRRWTNPVFGGKLYFKANSELLRRSRFRPPDRSDVTVERRPDPPARGSEELLEIARRAVASAGPSVLTPTSASAVGDEAQEPPVQAGNAASQQSGPDLTGTTERRATEVLPPGSTMQGLTPADAVAGAEAVLAATSEAANTIAAPEESETGETRESRTDVAADAGDAPPDRAAQLRAFLALADDFDSGEPPPHERPVDDADGEEPFDEEDEDVG
ncbi:hypothetical protein EPN44_14390 [bacterium]|nr:MAG: hypothetical protein EPN44_14390 [bacterium]